MLRIRGLRVGYGKAEVLHGISLDVEEKALVTLIGANGAGKSTTLMTISGILKPRGGTIEFKGKRIETERPDAIIRLGITQCPEGRRVFPEMTVIENLELGGYTLSAKETKKRLGYCFEMFPRLKERQPQLAGTLSGGEQQMLAIARALMGKPKLMMFDEPSMGLAPNLVEQVGEGIKRLNQDGMTVLLVEQNAFMALSMASQAYVLETGQIAISGEAKQMLQNEHIKTAYLGI